MNESACVSDLSLYELDRHHWLVEHDGSLIGFTTERGKLLAEQVGGCESLRAHQRIPGHINALSVSNENRLALGQCINTYKPIADFVTDSAVERARSYVQGLFCVSLGEVRVIRAAQHVMQASALGAVYSNGTRAHVVVVPEHSFDPVGVLVRQFAIAAHYTLMRGKVGLAAMMSDDLTQAMVGQYAVLRFATDHPEQCTVMRHMQFLVSWEFAKGLSKTPEMPMGFIASDLGEALMKAYGTGMFRAILQDLYESASHGRAIWFGSSNFTGTALALGFLGDDQGMQRFMAIDAGDRTLADKLSEAFPGAEEDHFQWIQVRFNETLSSVIAKSNAQAA
ncbi:TPA: hypothetical protein SL557_000206 [Pseudomonas aeruginosa]|nr:hypothetical protein [Pseudomonas aeruginosa]